MDESQFEKGCRIRREVLGDAYVDDSLAKDDFMAPFQRMATEWCWGATWSRKGLDYRSRIMLNLAMLTALGRTPQLALHVKGALANGVSVSEIQEILLHASVYCGVPAGLEAFKTARSVLEKEGALEA